MSASNNFPALKPSLLLDFTNSQTLDPRASYTCASPQEYFGGEVVVAEQNLVPWSEDFTKWTLNGGLTRSKNSVTADATTAHHRVSNAPSLATVSGMVYIQSWVVEQGGHRYIQLAVNNKPSDYCNFDLEDVVKGTYGGVGSDDAGIVDNGDGTCLVWMRYTAVGGDNDPTLQLTPSASVGRLASWTATGTETLGILRAQLEQRDFYTPYVKTEGTPITRYQPKLSVAPAGVPFFPVDPVTGEAQGLGIKPQVTNLWTWSEDYTQSVWYKNNFEVIPAQAIGPSGNPDMTKIRATSTGVGVWMQRGGAVTGGNTYSLLWVVKAGEVTRVGLSMNGTISGPSFAVFDLITGEVVAAVSVSSAKIKPLGNGLFLIGITATMLGATAGSDRRITLLNPDSTSLGGYTGNIGDGLYIERSAFVQGDYFDIPPKTEGSQVTRAATAATMPVSAIPNFNHAEGTLLVECATEKSGSAATGLSLYDSGNTNNSIVLGQWVSPDTTRKGIVLSNGSPIFQAAETGLQIGVKRSFALSYSDSVVACAMDGVGSQATPSAQIPKTLGTIGLGANPQGSSQLCGSIEKVAYYPKALSAPELEALTK